jgi:UDP-N-acetylmuramoylalanine--D-glutamate ligase
MKIAIAGYGVEGKANFSYWNRPENDITIVDERESLDDLPDNAKTLLGPGSFEQLQGFDLVVRTAGLAPYKIKTDGKIWSSTNEFFAKCPVPIIGVTGTKGKGTTCSLIASILRAAGKTVHLVGNIGVPALEELSKIQANDVIVFEMSSFQLWDIDKSPHIAVVLMIEPDHLNVHMDFEDYVNAKARIVSYQTSNDVVIYNQNNPYARDIAEKSVARKIVYPFAITEFADSLKLPGKHNQENASAAIAAAREFGVSDDEIRQGLVTFEGLPHRLEKVRELDGVTYYNDSFSSAPSATVAAIRSFDAPEIVIIGGVDKGANFEELSKVLKESSQVKTVILIGAIRSKLAEQFSSSSAKILISDARTMPEIVAEAHARTEPGDVVLLSPACSSFDMFKNFYDRGDQFRDVVNAL